MSEDIFKIIGDQRKRVDVPNKPRFKVAEGPHGACLAAILKIDAELENLHAENERLRWILNQIITHLPSNRDWLDPDVEREARDTLASTPGGEGG